MSVAPSHQTFHASLSHLSAAWLCGPTLPLGCRVARWSCKAARRLQSSRPRSRATVLLMACVPAVLRLLSACVSPLGGYTSDLQNENGRRDGKRTERVSAVLLFRT